MFQLLSFFQDAQSKKEDRPWFHLGDQAKDPVQPRGVGGPSHLVSAHPLQLGLIGASLSSDSTSLHWEIATSSGNNLITPGRGLHPKWPPTLGMKKTKQKEICLMCDSVYLSGRSLKEKYPSLRQ